MVGIFVAEDVHENVSIGECGFIASNYIPQTDTSIMLLPQYHGVGYGRRILRTLYGLWVYEIGQSTCVATVWQSNVAARSILSSEGFSQTSEYIDVRVDEPCLVYERSRVAIAT